VVCASKGVESTPVPESAVEENPFCPVSEHDVAATLVQVSLVEVSLRTRVGSAESVTVGRHWVSEGVTALQEPLQRMVPVPGIPQTFVAGTDAHALPKLDGTGGTVAEQVQLDV